MPKDFTSCRVFVSLNDSKGRQIDELERSLHREIGLTRRSMEFATLRSEKVAQMLK